MNPVTNPYAPGAGSEPPELAGRDEIFSRTEITLARVKLRAPLIIMLFRFSRYGTH